MPLPKLLLCTDLDRTLIPNGPEAESPLARPFFRQLCNEPKLTLVYVSGRDKDLITVAIDEFNLPIPDYVISDVGSVIYEINNNIWSVFQQWSNTIALDWNKYSPQDIHNILSPITQLILQEPSKQNTHKLSYYLPLQHSHSTITHKIEHILTSKNINANIIWSIETIKNTGLIDILPASANKLTAIRWLAGNIDICENSILFAGDSGNDIDVINSSISSIIVANASNEFKSLALSISQAKHTESRLYVAQGMSDEMNGNYASGIIEGVCHYIPEAEAWFESTSRSLRKASS